MGTYIADFQTFSIGILVARVIIGLLMAAQVFTDVDRYWSKFLTDIPFVLILSLGIFLWRPRTKADELARS